MKTPILVTTSEAWANETYVVFDDQKIEDLIPSEWVCDRRLYESEENDNELSYEECLAIMKYEFEEANSSVDDFWPEKNILCCGQDFYQYSETGQCKYVGRFDSIADYLEWADE